MKSRNRFIIGLVTAAITFGALLLIAGPEKFAKYNRHYSKHCMEQKSAGDKPGSE